MKKIILAVVMLAAVLTGCQTAEKAEDNGWAVKIMIKPFQERNLTYIFTRHRKALKVSEERIYGRRILTEGLRKPWRRRTRCLR